jgi:hypothetical protein
LWSEGGQDSEELMQRWRQQFQQGMQSGDNTWQYQPAAPPIDPMYVMQKNNPFLAKKNEQKSDNGEAFKRGLVLMKSGNLKEAIQAFEVSDTKHKR